MIEAFTICLRHPGQIIGLNGRGHWAQEKKEKDRVKEETHFRLLEQRVPRTFRPNRYRITWYHDKTGPDDDNIIGRIKYVRDTVASYLRMNDREIKLGDDPVRIVHDPERSHQVEVIFYKKVAREAGVENSVSPFCPVCGAEMERFTTEDGMSAYRCSQGYRMEVPMYHYLGTMLDPDAMLARKKCLLFLEYYARKEGLNDALS